MYIHDNSVIGELIDFLPSNISSLIFLCKHQLIKTVNLIFSLNTTQKS